MKKLKANKSGRLPNLIIIGAQKCGTTSLHYYLSLHPEIFMSKEKELRFFVKKNNWKKGIDWYKSNFTGEAKIYGETSPPYSNCMLYSDVPERMHSIVPDAKLIYIIRDPIDRIISNYVHFYSAGREKKTMLEVLEHLNDTNHYVSRSKYYMQLEKYLNYYPRSNIMIITLEDLRDDCRYTMQRVFRFLGIDDTFYSPKFKTIIHKSDDKKKKSRVELFLKKMSETNLARMFPTVVRMDIGKTLYLPFSSRIEQPVLSENLKNKLIDYLKDDIDRLRRYTGYDFKGWCV